MKSILIAYLLWFLGMFGVLGFHRFYLKKYGTGVLWLLTGGLFGFGAFIDLFVLWHLVNKFNREEGGAAVGAGSNMSMSNMPYGSINTAGSGIVGNNKLDVDFTKMVWQRTFKRDFRYSAPQKLWRHIHDALELNNFKNIHVNIEPSIHPTVIGDTGLTNGRIVAETIPMEKENESKKLAYIFLGIGGVLLLLPLILGFVILLFGLPKLLFIVALISIVIPIIFFVLGFMRSRKEFISYIIEIAIKGEVYKSDSSMAGANAMNVAVPRRGDISSDLRMNVNFIYATTRNSGGGFRTIVGTEDSQHLDQIFNKVIQDIYRYGNIR